MTLPGEVRNNFRLPQAGMFTGCLAPLPGWRPRQSHYSYGQGEETWMGDSLS
jgi:hypothetical protein